MMRYMPKIVFLLAFDGSNSVFGSLSEDLSATFLAAEESLSAFHETTRLVDVSLTHLSQLQNQQIAGLEKLRDSVASQTERVEKGIRQVNARQLQELADKLSDIKDVVSSQRRPEILSESDIATLEELQDLFSSDSILADAEAELETWMLGLMAEVIADRPPIVTTIQVPSNDLGPENCVTPAEAAQEIQLALVRYSQDGIGRKDHTQGATIVHELTSQTFSPPPEQRHLLGNVWWNKYIPEDWENFLLPKDWQYWDVSIPSYLLHTFGWKRGATAPPETILHSLTLPGSCWPMQGASGKVTFALLYPVKVSAISFDHASKLLLPNYKEQMKSAPKNVKVVGYPPCTGKCAGLSFDLNDKKTLANIMYDMEGPTVQTFTIAAGKVADNSNGSCSAATSSCKGPAEIWATIEDVVSAIQVEIIDNWGNQDYTCLYRVRVHGEPAL
jgi:Sad1 / UNC-like C-terminal